MKIATQLEPHLPRYELLAPFLYPQVSMWAYYIRVEGVLGGRHDTVGVGNAGDYPTRVRFNI